MGQQSEAGAPLTQPQKSLIAVIFFGMPFSDISLVPAITLDSPTI